MDFAEQKRGYNKEQVRGYIESIAVEYRKMQAEYERVYNRCQELEASEKAAREEADTLRAELDGVLSLQTQSTPQPDADIPGPAVITYNEPLPAEPAAAAGPQPAVSADVIGQALIDVKEMAQVILDNANAEAERINARAAAEAGEMLSAARAESEKARSGIRREVEELTQARTRLHKELRDMQVFLNAVMRRSPGTADGTDVAL